jgi:hypothetical protein
VQRPEINAYKPLSFKWQFLEGSDHKNGISALSITTSLTHKPEPQNLSVDVPISSIIYAYHSRTWI